MAIEFASAAQAVVPRVTGPVHVEAGSGASLASEASFAGAVEKATVSGTVPGQNPVGPAIKGIMGALEQVNAQGRNVADYASAVTSAGREMSPAEIVSLTMRCQEFMFHCQLSSNIANRTSDGLQQLFRQQS